MLKIFIHIDCVKRTPLNTLKTINENRVNLGFGD